MEKVPTSATLQRNVKKVESMMLETINVLLVDHAIAAEIKDGNKIRVDCTVAETNIHDPSDSSLLADSVRVLVRLMDRAQEYVDAPFMNHHRRAKRRAIGILHARTQDDRLPLYRDLLKVGPMIFEIFDSLRRYLELVRRVATQTHRRRARRNGSGQREVGLELRDPQ